MTEGDKLKYTGKGFMGFDPSFTEMKFLQESGFDYLVEYKGETVRVREYEVEKNITDDERIYPCADCGTMRSKNEGGTTFTVCNDCWDEPYRKTSVSLT